jgi:hypothetical protein
MFTPVGQTDAFGVRWVIAEYYRTVSTFLGIMVVSCSSVSAVLLWDAVPPDGLRVLDPVATKATVLVLLALLGVVLPLVAALRPQKRQGSPRRYSRPPP